MSTPILCTKLYIPAARLNLVTRTRLLDQLQKNADRKLILISAPAGYGKTTLLSDWISRSEFPFCWLSLDEQDNDQERFLAYLIASLKSIAIEVHEGITVSLQSQHPDMLEAVLIPLINQISAARRDFALVLDDYYLIQNQTIHDSINYLLDNLPPNMHIIIATRMDPPFRLAQMRVRGDLCEIRGIDLRFTNQEAVQFLNQCMGLGLTSFDITTLSEKTEGWIAGLQLAAISLQGNPDKEAFIRAFAGDDRYIADYLLDEALERQPPHLQTFLLQTSILDRLSAPLCDALTGWNDCQAILRELEAANLFLISLDKQRNWYRYHRLFAELLQVRLVQAGSVEVEKLYRRISAWHEKEGLLSQAALYALKAGDLQRVSGLIEKNTFALVDSHELSALLKQLENLSKDVYRSEPWLALTKAWMLAFTGHFREVEPIIDAVEDNVRTSKNENRSRLLGRILSLRAYTASSYGNKTASIHLARKALDYIPEKNLSLRGFTLSLMGNAYRDIGELETAVGLLDESALLARAADESTMSIITLCRLVSVQQLLGQLSKAQVTCQEALHIAEEFRSRTGQIPPGISIAKLRFGNILYLKNDLDSALQYVEDGLLQAKNWGQVDVLLFGLRIKAKILHAIGDADGSVETIQTRAQILQKLNPAAAEYRMHEAHIRLICGDMDWVADWVSSRNLSIQDEIYYHNYFLYYIFLRYLYFKRQIEKSEFLLARLLEIIEQSGAILRKIELMVYKAMFRFERGDLDQAFDVLDQALYLARPEGFVRAFINPGEPMPRLIYQAALQGIHPEYCYFLLDQFHKSRYLVQAMQSDLVEPLSCREIEVLKLISDGCSNQEIAGDLTLSLYTVKSHARNIYGKLGVKNRTEAVAKARLLGLLPLV